MNSNKRPVSVLVLACLYIAVGAIGFSYHFPELLASRQNSVWVEVIELLAIVSGVFMILGYNWARWFSLAWMAFHVVISFPVLRQFAIHLVFFLIIAWILFRPEARRHFAGTRAHSGS